MRLREPWRSLIAVVATAAASHFGTEALRAPEVEGAECARLLMSVVQTCEACP